MELDYLDLEICKDISAILTEYGWELIEGNDKAAHYQKKDKGDVFNFFYVIKKLDDMDIIEYCTVVNNILLGGKPHKLLASMFVRYAKEGETFVKVDGIRRNMAIDSVIKQAKKVPPQYKPPFFVERVRLCERCSKEAAEPNITICKTCVKKEVDELFGTMFRLG